MAQESTQLADRYRRIAQQLEELFNTGPKATDDPIARMASTAALLQHKMPHFFWTGFYRREDGRLVVGPYQGPLACAILPGREGVCWACVQRKESIIVPDVHAFGGHVACDSRSQSEIVIPVREPAGNIVAVLDVDSDQPDAFSETDRMGLTRIADLVYLP
ncbi:MAG: GAF domain-containing protein [Gemmatimonadales bacterium]|nr:GAF domain-containing protein [Gemmatimonadales bacterium]